MGRHKIECICEGCTTRRTRRKEMEELYHNHKNKAEEKRTPQTEKQNERSGPDYTPPERQLEEVSSSFFNTIDDYADSEPDLQDYEVLEDQNERPEEETQKQVSDNPFLKGEFLIMIMDLFLPTIIVLISKKLFKKDIKKEELKLEQEEIDILTECINNVTETMTSEIKPIPALIMTVFAIYSFKIYANG